MISNGNTVILCWQNLTLPCWLASILSLDKCTQRLSTLSSLSHSSNHFTTFVAASLLAGQLCWTFGLNGSQQRNRPAQKISFSSRLRIFLCLSLVLYLLYPHPHSGIQYLQWTEGKWQLYYQNVSFVLLSPVKGLLCYCRSWWTTCQKLLLCSIFIQTRHNYTIAICIKHVVLRFTFSLVNSIFMDCYLLKYMYILFASLYIHSIYAFFYKYHSNYFIIVCKSSKIFCFYAAIAIP